MLGSCRTLSALSVVPRAVAVVAGAEQAQLVGRDRHRHRSRRVLKAAEEEPRHPLVGLEEHLLVILPHLVPGETDGREK